MSLRPRFPLLGPFNCFTALEFTALVYKAPDFTQIGHTERGGTRKGGNTIILNIFELFLKLKSNFCIKPCF